MYNYIWLMGVNDTYSIWLMGVYSPNSSRKTPSWPSFSTSLRGVQARQRRWICEHRWQGVAGMIHFRSLAQQPNLGIMAT